MGQSDSTHLLTPVQCQSLQRSWQRSPRSGVDNIGARLFTKVYRTEPALGQLFGWDQIPPAEIKFNGKFQEHCMIFIRTLDYIMTNLTSLDLVINYCKGLGRRHVKFIDRGFQPAYWDVFGKALTESQIDWDGGARNREAMDGWRKLVAFIIEQMRDGFEEQRKADLEEAALRKRLSEADQI